MSVETTTSWDRRAPLDPWWSKAPGRAELAVEPTAESCLRYAQAAFGDGEYDVAAGNAVIDGVAAADAICCVRLGERSADDDHQRARAHLARAYTAAAALG